MDARGAALVGFIGGVAVSGAAIVYFVKLRKHALKNAVGANALVVINQELPNIARQEPAFALVFNSVDGTPLFERLKRRIAYDVLGQAVEDAL